MLYLQHSGGVDALCLPMQQYHCCRPSRALHSENPRPYRDADAGIDAGGKQEALEAYEEAYNAIFALQLQCHRHTQPHAKNDGTLRWEMIEMWPMPVCTSAACRNYCTPVAITSVHSHVPSLYVPWVMQWQAYAMRETLSSLGLVLCCCACNNARCYRLMEHQRLPPCLAWCSAAAHAKTSLDDTILCRTTDFLRAWCFAAMHARRCILASRHILAEQPGGQTRLLMQAWKGLK